MTFETNGEPCMCHYCFASRLKGIGPVVEQSRLVQSLQKKEKKDGKETLRLVIQLLTDLLKKD